MNDTENPMARINPTRLSSTSRFRFKCHKDISCFTQCCRGINIILTPYDILRMKKRLGLPSDEFLAIYTKLELLEKTDIPVVTLKLLDDAAQSCPFVRDDGCLIYTDRPTACRYYPVGMASLAHKDGADNDFFFFVNEPHCRGFEEDTEWDVASWRGDQGVDLNDEINAGWTELMVYKRSFPPNVKWSEQAKQMFFMACYNLDEFRRFVFESTFLDRYDIDAERVEKIRADEIELLRFGMEWLKFLLFKQGEFKLTAKGRGQNP